MKNYLTTKLETHAPLGDSDVALLNDVVRSPREVRARETITREGDEPGGVQLVVEGMAYRHKHLPDGTRQIIAYLVPGDFCDVHGSILRRMDHSLSALSRCRIVDISRVRLLELTERPAIQRALLWATLVDQAVLREWIVNIGSRPPDQRIAHLLCEMMVRLQTVGLSDGTRCHLPLTQLDIGDTLGLSTVHINRTMQGLQEKALFEKRRDQLFVGDLQRLAAFSGFDPTYLHLDGLRVDERRSAGRPGRAMPPRNNGRDHSVPLAAEGVLPELR